MYHNIRFVQQTHPLATARYHPPTYELGQRSPTQAGWWAIYPMLGLGYKPIGIGSTKAGAWANAALRLQAA